MFIVKNLMENRECECTLKRGANRTIVIYPVKDNGPTPAVELLQDGVSIGIFDEQRYPLTYHKFVKRDTGAYVKGYYTFFPATAEIPDINGIPIPLDDGITEAMHANVPHGREDCTFPSAFSIVCVD